MADKNFISGLLLEGSRFEGKLEFKDRMCIEGEFKGEIISKDQLIVGKAAKVDAKIQVGEMIVMGEVKGHVTECQRLQIQAGGRVLADVRVATLDIQPGAILDGKCAMIKPSNKNNSPAGK